MRSRVVVQLACRDRLVMPQVFACRGIQGNNGIGQQVIELFGVRDVDILGKNTVCSQV